MRRPLALVAGFMVALAAASALPAQELPLAPRRSSEQSVTPVFEGWYRNSDGTYSLSFGYFNRNADEVLDIPIGASNRIQPDGPDRGQPTRFQPRRHWGVFAVKVPSDFGARRIVWTLIVRGDTFAVPGSLKQGWEIDALAGEAGTGNTPPVLRFAPDAPAGIGPGGVTAGPLTARPGVPLTLTVWATDDGRARSAITGVGQQGARVTLTWLTYRGPGDVVFTDPTPAVGAADGRSTTTATFAAPGEYILRVRANDASGVESAGHAQCCWTNAFVKVLVTHRQETAS
jgi:hypothetical protein